MHEYVAITRAVSRGLAGCELSFVARAPIDVDRAIAQHHDYCEALRALECRVIELPPIDSMPDAVFVEDVALVLDEVAVMTRPGAASRRGEGASVARVLGEFRPLLEIVAPGTLDGGDLLRIDRTIYVGMSARSNADGIAQLRSLLSPWNYSVQPVPTRDCLHLKSAVTLVAHDTVLVQPEWVDVDVFAGHRRIEIDPSEAHAANALRIGATVLYPDCFPRTRQRMQAAGIAVVAMDMSELQKAEGAMTCCSLVFSNNG